MISWLRVSLAVWRCVELEPVLATAGVGFIASLCAPRALVSAPVLAAVERQVRCGW